MTEFWDLPRLLLGTVIDRPYVYAFLACYFFFAWRQMGAGGCVAFLVMAYLIAFGCEYSSTRNGFPFGIYVYHEALRDRELWISNVPFWDSLSFVFLSYFSWVVAGGIRAGVDQAQALRLPSTAVLGGALMTVLDVVIDPLTLRGDRWFLGKVYEYPEGGAYFGVTLSNFGGWFVVGSLIPLAYQAIERIGIVRPWRGLGRVELLGAFGVYAGVLAFNLAITAWIGEWALLAVSAAVAGTTLGLCWRGGLGRRVIQ